MKKQIVISELKEKTSLIRMELIKKDSQFTIEDISWHSTVDPYEAGEIVKELFLSGEITIAFSHQARERMVTTLREIGSSNPELDKDFVEELVRDARGKNPKYNKVEEKKLTVFQAIKKFIFAVLNKRRRKQ